MRAARSFVVLSVVVDEGGVDDLLHEVSGVPILAVHEHAIRGPGELASEFLEGEDEERTRLLLSCSIDGQHNQLQLEELIARILPTRRATLWMTSPCLIPLYNGKGEDLHIQRQISEDSFSIMQENGLAFMQQAVDIEVVEALLRVAAERIAEIENLINSEHPEIRLGVDLFAFQEAASRGIHRYDVLFDQDDPRSNLIVSLSNNGPWVPYVHQLLGTSDLHILHSVVYSDPGSEDQDWHSDGPHQGKDCYAICVFLPLVNLDETVGFTQFYPRSHRHESLLGMGGASLATGSAINAIFKKGDAVLYDYRTIHRGIGNRSSGTRRPLLQFVYHMKSYKEARNYGRASLLKR